MLFTSVGMLAVMPCQACRGTRSPCGAQVREFRAVTGPESVLCKAKAPCAFLGGNMLCVAPGSSKAPGVPVAVLAEARALGCGSSPTQV